MDANGLELNRLELGSQGASPSRPPEFYMSHPAANRTLRMDAGGLCQFCGRKAARRVELHSPLWQTGPLMYGDCCLPEAEAALLAPRPASYEPRSAAYSGEQANGITRKVWLAVAITTSLWTLIFCLEHLKYGLPKGF